MRGLLIDDRFVGGIGGDQRGHGESSSKHCHGGVTEVDDLLGVLDQLPGELLQHGLVLYGRSMGAGSALGAGAEIKPHTAPMNLRLRVHVPLMVPEGDVGMRLAGEAVAWRRGEALVFDDSFVHETWNRTAADRVVLLFDVWHPDLGEDEIGAVVEMFRRAAAKPK